MYMSVLQLGQQKFLHVSEVHSSYLLQTPPLLDSMKCQSLLLAHPSIKYKQYKKI